MTVLIVVGIVVVLVGALLALDWFTAGRVGRRNFKAARDGEAGNPNPGYAMIEQQSIHMQNKSPNG